MFHYKNKKGQTNLSGVGWKEGGEAILKANLNGRDRKVKTPLLPSKTIVIYDT